MLHFLKILSKLYFLIYWSIVSVHIMLVLGVQYSGLTFKYIMKWSSWCLATMCPYLLLFSCLVMSDSLQPHGLQQAWFTISWSLLKLVSIESVMPSNHLIICCPHILLSIFPSVRVFLNGSALCIRWPNYWSFSFNISPSNEYSGLTGLISLPSKGLSSQPFGEDQV